MADTEAGPPPALMDALVLAAFGVMAVLNQAAAAHDLSLTQLRALAILRDREPRMAELAAYLGLDRSSVSGLIDRAARRGLVRRGISGDDGRAVLVSLTPDGRRLAGEVAAEVAALLAPMTAGLAPAEGRRLGELLTRLLPPAAQG